MATNSIESSDFNKMTVTEIKNCLVDHGVSVSGYNKAALVKIASSVRKAALFSQRAQ